MRIVFLAFLVLVPALAGAINAPDPRHIEMSQRLEVIQRCAALIGRRGNPDVAFQALYGMFANNSTQVTRPSPLALRLLESNATYRALALMTRLQYEPIGNESTDNQGFSPREQDLQELIGLWASSLQPNSSRQDVLLFQTTAKIFTRYIRTAPVGSPFIRHYYDLAFKGIREAGLQLYENNRRTFQPVWLEAGRSVFDNLEELSDRVDSFTPEAMDAWALALAFDFYEYSPYNPRKTYRDTLLEIFSRSKSYELHKQTIDIFNNFISRNRSRGNRVALRMGSSGFLSWYRGKTVSVLLSSFLQKYGEEPNPLKVFETRMVEQIKQRTEQAYPLVGTESEFYNGNVLRGHVLQLEDDLKAKWGS